MKGDGPSTDEHYLSWGTNAWGAGSQGVPALEDNTVFIGKKPAMNYVLAVVTQFNTGTSKVFIKARGRAISKAVDVAEIVKNRFVQASQIGHIKIGTENVEDEEREEGINVSWIEITLVKTPPVQTP